MTETQRSKVTCPGFTYLEAFSGGSAGKESAFSALDAGEASSILWSGRSPGEGNGNPPQYSCLGNPLDRGTWQARIHEVSKESNVTRRHTHLWWAVKWRGLTLAGSLQP